MSSTKSSCKTFELKFIKQVQTAPLPYTLQTRPVKNKEPWLVNILSANYKKNKYIHSIIIYCQLLKIGWTK